MVRSDMGQVLNRHLKDSLMNGRQPPYLPSQYLEIVLPVLI